MNSTNTRGTCDYNLRNKEQNRGGNLQSTPPRLVTEDDTAQPNSKPSQQSTRPNMPSGSGAGGRRPDPELTPDAHLDSNVSIISELRKMFADFKTELSNKLDHVILDLDSVKSDIAVVKTKMQTLEDSVADTSARISTVEDEKIPYIERRLKEIEADYEDKLMQQELHNRKQNLLFYGIPSHPNEHIYNVAAGAFAKVLEIPMDEAMNIPTVNIHRLPTKKPYGGASNAPEPPNPIIVRFMKMSDRDRVLQAFEQPRQPRSANGNTAAGPGDRITVRTDLPPKMKRERGRLASVAYKLRKTKQL